MTTVTDPYVIISADAHAGLPCEEYRPYLESRYHPAFDEFLAERHALRDEQMKLNYDYINGWETEHAEGLRGAFDAEQRDKEMNADGVAAEVIFPDADSITGMESPPFGAGLSAGMIEDPELAFAGARAHNRFLVELCATSPLRRGGVGLVPITHDVDPRGRRDRVARRDPGHPRDHDPHDVAGPHALQRPELRPGVGGLRGRRTCPCTRTPARPPGRR